MTFVPRTFAQIVDDMLAYIQANSQITDTEVGGVVRTIVEAAALEDDEQYFQMIQILDMFSIANASGSDVDRRLADYGIIRGEAKASTVRLRISDGTRKRSTLDMDVVAGSTTLPLLDSQQFPSSGFPYTIRIGEGTPAVEDVQITANNSATNELTTATPLANDHEAADLVVLVTGTTARTINIGTQCQVPPMAGSKAIVFSTVEPGYIQAGNFRSNEILARAAAVGSRGNVSSGRVTRFVATPPFNGALVTNVTGASGGTDVESDEELKIRGIQHIQSLSRGTPVAIVSKAINVTDNATGQRVVSASLVEDFSTDEVILYIDDGSGFSPNFVNLATDALSTNVSLGSMAISLYDGLDFPTSGWLLIDADGVNPAELVQFTDRTASVFTLNTPLTSNHNQDSIVRLVQIVDEASEAGRRRFRLQNAPVVRNSERIYVKDTVAPWRLLVRDVDYIINKGTGEFQIIDSAGLTAGTTVAVNYSYYTNLIAETQKVLEGDLGDSVTYPGVKAAGIHLTVEAPVIRRVTIRVSFSAEIGYNEEDLKSVIQARIEDYVNSLKIGEDVIRSKLFDVVHNVRGVYSVNIHLPTNNITILENELPVPFAADGSSLVTVF